MESPKIQQNLLRFGRGCRCALPLGGGDPSKLSGGLFCHAVQINIEVRCGGAIASGSCGTEQSVLPVVRRNRRM